MPPPGRAIWARGEPLVLPHSCAVAVLVDEVARVLAPVPRSRHHPLSSRHRPHPFSYLLDFWECRFALLPRTPPTPTPAGLFSTVQFRRVPEDATSRTLPPATMRLPGPSSR